MKVFLSPSLSYELLIETHRVPWTNAIVLCRPVAADFNVPPTTHVAVVVTSAVKVPMVVAVLGMGFSGSSKGKTGDDCQS